MQKNTLQHFQMGASACRLPCSQLCCMILLYVGGLMTRTLTYIN